MHVKTSRLTLLLSSAEKAGITRKAAAAGMSASEFVRQAAALLDAEDMQTLREVHGLLPEFNAALARIHENLAGALEHAAELERGLEDARTPEYRKGVFEEIGADPAMIEAGAALFGAEPTASGQAAVRPRSAVAQAEAPADSPFERPAPIARRAAKVAERREPWRDEGSSAAEADG